MAISTERRRASAGFSIAELAMVLVLIGLIVAAVFTARVILRGAELRSFITDVEMYRTAVDQFEQQYGGIPGDIYNATEFWPDDTDGNHDGRIDPWNTEGLQGWLHLQHAGLIKGSYTGAVSGGDAVPGINVPATKRDGIGYSLYYVAASDASWDHGDTPGDASVTIPRNSQGNVLIMGGVTTGSFTSAPRLSQRDSLTIDEKVDDGWPDSGAIQSQVGGACTLVSGGRLIYDAAHNADAKCALAFKLQTN